MAAKRKKTHKTSWDGRALSDDEPGLKSQSKWVFYLCFGSWAVHETTLSFVISYHTERQTSKQTKIT